MLFMSDFFKKSDLSRNEAEDIVSDTLNKCDDGELYLEDSKSESILLDDNKIKNSSYSSDLGFGLRAISDEIAIQLFQLRLQSGRQKIYQNELTGHSGLA